MNGFTLSQAGSAGGEREQATRELKGCLAASYGFRRMEIPLIHEGFLRLWLPATLLRLCGGGGWGGGELPRSLSEVHVGGAVGDVLQRNQAWLLFCGIFNLLGLERSSGRMCVLSFSRIRTFFAGILAMALASNFLASLLSRAMSSKSPGRCPSCPDFDQTVFVGGLTFQRSNGKPGAHRRRWQKERMVGKLQASRPRRYTI